MIRPRRSIVAKPAGAAEPSTRGTATIEFALVAPLVFALLLAVFQVGLALQAHHAMRGIAADIVRRVAVENQKSNVMTNEQIRLQGTAIAVRPPYQLDSSRVTVIVDDAAQQRIAGARELSFRIGYAVPNLLRMTGMPDLDISYDRSLFVTATPPSA